MSEHSAAPAQPNPSANQRLAADPAVSAWVDASAGSGKTKVLTDRVLALLLSGAAPHKILCLTFTKAAAGEMANRIAHRLSSWARLSDDELADDLETLSGAKPTPEETGRARRLFARVQEAPGGVRIDTMHAFCQSVLQRFPVEANVPPHFDVLDERDQRALLTAARDGLVLDVAAEPQSALADAWNRMLRRLSESGFDRLMLELMKHRERLRMATPSAVAQALKANPNLSTDVIRAMACEEGRFDRAALQSLIEPMLAESKSVQEPARVIATWLESPPEARDFDAYSAALLTAERAPRQMARYKPFKNDPDLLDIITTEQERLAEAWNEIAKTEALTDTSALLTVAQDLLERYRQAKAIRSKLDYDDLIEGTSRLLVNPGAAWVHFKLDGGIDHVLVDEAQDTSPPQWEVIASLIKEFFAGASAREGQRTFFAVGDPKQSIYGFQGADPAEFHRRRAEFKRDADASGETWRDVPLNVSFRSAQAVLDFVDSVFRDPSILGLGEGEVRHHAHRTGAPGRIEVWPLLEADGSDSGADDIWTVPRVYGATSSAEERFARTVARKIKALVDSGEVLAATEKPIQPGDIMVLVRSRRRFGTTLVNALKRLEVPVAGLDRMALARQLVVKDLTAFGQFLLLPEDDLTLAAILKGPFFVWSEERLFDLAYNRPGYLWNALQASAAPEDQVDCQRLLKWLAQAPGMAPFAIYSRLLIEQRGREAIRRYIGPEADDPVDEFLALALSFPQHGPPTLQHFLQWLAADDIEIKRELDQGERNEVRLLTVHAAKGLQAPIVILPDTAVEPKANWDALTWAGKTPIWAASSKQQRDPESQTLRNAASELSIQEEARLLYVALTRAEDRLYIGGWKATKEPTEKTWYQRVIAACEALEAESAMTPEDFQLEGLEGSGYTMGEAAALSSEEQPAADTGRPPLPYWASEPAPAEAQPKRPLAPSRPSPPPPAARSPLRDRTAETKRFQRGLLLHRLFEHLPGIPAHDRQATAGRILSDAALEEPALAALLETAESVLNHPDFAPIFSSDALAEAPLTGIVGGQTVSGVVDRLLVTPAKVLVVDYKTNRLPPPDADSVPLSYKRQMQTYARLLAGIYPDREIQTALLWTEAPRLDIVPVPQGVN